MTFLYKLPSKRLLKHYRLFTVGSNADMPGLSHHRIMHICYGDELIRKLFEILISSNRAQHFNITII